MKTFKEAVSQTISFVLILSLTLPVSGWASPVEAEVNPPNAEKNAGADAKPIPKKRVPFAEWRAAKGPASSLSSPLTDPLPVVPIPPVPSQPPVPVNPENPTQIVFPNPPVLRPGEVINGKASMQIDTQWVRGLNMIAGYQVMLYYKRPSDTEYLSQTMFSWRFEPAFGTDFRVNLENLDPGTLYDFRIEVKDLRGNVVASLDRVPRTGSPLTFTTNRPKEEPDPNIILENPPIVRNEKMFLQINTQWMKGVDMTRHRVMIRYQLDDSEEPEFSQIMSSPRTDPLLGSDYATSLLVGNTVPGMTGLRSGRTYRFRIVVEDIMSGSIVASLDRDPTSGRPLTFTTDTD